MSYRDLMANLAKDFSSLRPCRLAILGDSATQFLAKAIKAHGFDEGMSCEVFDADFDQLDRQILDAGSELYHFRPEFIVLYLCAEKLWSRFAATPREQRGQFSGKILGEIQVWWKTIGQFSNARIIQL